MSNRFEEALKHILAHEGGKVDHPKDPGGRTNMGITQRVYNGWRSKSNLPSRDVYLIDKSEVEAIYRFQYWEPIMGDQLPEGVDFVVMDGAVNSGVGQSVKWLQRALGALYTSGIDGIMGAGTLGAVRATNDYDALIERIIERREAFLRALKTFPTFGRGWMRRISAVKQVGQAWASGSVGTAPDRHIPAVGGNEKALIEDAKQAPGKGVADSVTGGGVGAGGIGIAVNQLQEQLTPYSMAGDWIANLVVGLMILGFALTVGGLIYRWYANRKRNDLADALDLQPVSK